MQVTWSSLISSAATSPLGRSSHFSALIKKTLYVFSGENIPRVPIDNTLHAFDLTTRQWQNIANDAGPCARVGHAGTVIGNRFFIYGGRTGAKFADESLSDFWSFDTSSAQWMRHSATTTPPALSYHTMTSDGAHVYLFGGCTVDHGRTSALWRYDPNSNEWKELAASATSSSPSPRGGSSVVYVGSDHSLRVMFGYNGKNELADHYRYDLSSGEWSAVDVKNIPPARSVTDVVSLPAVGTKGSLLVFGGEFTPSVHGHEGAGAYHHDCWIFDIAQTQWKQCNNDGQKPSARGWFTTNTDSQDLSSTEVVVFGGFDGVDRLADVYLGKVNTI